MSNLTHSNGNGTGYGNVTLLMNPELCTLQTCDLSLSSFLYLPTIPGNAVYAGIFGLLLVGQLYLGVRYKTWGYMIAILLGLMLEIVGYVARIMLNISPFDNDFFLMYLITLTIAPAFLSAAIYLCLSRIVILYGAHLSRFKPRTYTIVFCTCDFISLVLQAAGGGIASSADTPSLQDIGKDIMLAGLSFQVCSLILFTICGIDFAFCVRNGKGNWNKKHLPLVNSCLFKSFLVGLVVATVTIFARSVYRCVELSGGFNGTLFVNDEILFIVMEGVMIAIACCCLTFLHPAVCFQGAWHKASFSFRTRMYSGEAKVSRLSQGEYSNIELGRLTGDAQHRDSDGR